MPRVHYIRVINCEQDITNRMSVIGRAITVAKESLWRSTYLAIKWHKHPKMTNNLAVKSPLEGHGEIK